MLRYFGFLIVGLITILGGCQSSQQFTEADENFIALSGKRGFSNLVPIAYTEYVGVFGEASPEKARSFLLDFLYKTEESNVKKNLLLLRKYSPRDAFTRLFDLEAKTAIRMRENPELAYAEYKRQKQSLPDSKIPHHLMTVALSAKLPRVEFDRAMAVINGGKKPYEYILPLDHEIKKGAGPVMLHNLAMRDYAPAYRELIRLYLTGKGVKKSNMRAYYWVNRAEQKGIDYFAVYSGNAATLQNQLTKWEKMDLQVWRDKHNQPPLPE